MLGVFWSGYGKELDRIVKKGNDEERIKKGNVWKFEKIQWNIIKWDDVSKKTRIWEIYTKIKEWVEKLKKNILMEMENKNNFCSFCIQE